MSSLIRGTEFEHGAKVIVAAKLRRTVEVSHAVEYQGREKRIRRIQWPAEAVEHSLIPASAAVRRNFKYDSTSHIGYPDTPAHPTVSSHRSCPYRQR